MTRLIRRIFTEFGCLSLPLLFCSSELGAVWEPCHSALSRNALIDIPRGAEIDPGSVDGITRHHELRLVRSIPLERPLDVAERLLEAFSTPKAGELGVLQPPKKEDPALVEWIYEPPMDPEGNIYGRRAYAVTATTTYFDVPDKEPKSLIPTDISGKSAPLRLFGIYLSSTHEAWAGSTGHDFERTYQSIKVSGLPGGDVIRSDQQPVVPWAGKLPFSEGAYLANSEDAGSVFFKNRHWLTWRSVWRSASLKPNELILPVTNDLIEESGGSPYVEAAGSVALTLEKVANARAPYDDLEPVGLVTNERFGLSLAYFHDQKTFTRVGFVNIDLYTVKRSGRVPVVGLHLDIEIVPEFFTKNTQVTVEVLDRFQAALKRHFPFEGNGNLSLLVNKLAWVNWER